MKFHNQIANHVKITLRKIISVNIYNNHSATGWQSKKIMQDLIAHKSEGFSLCTNHNYSQSVSISCEVVQNIHTIF